jgi:hypothetical protein
MNSDYPFLVTLGRTHEVSRIFERPQTRRAGLPASHSGVADVSSTPNRFAMAWINKIIESSLLPVKPSAAKPALRTSSPL